MNRKATACNISLWALRLNGVALFPGWCNLCKRPTLFLIRQKNLREDVRCLLCRSFNRQRQVGRVFRQRLEIYQRPQNEVRVWNTESSMALHGYLKRIFADRYVASEYLEQGLPSGRFVNEVRHEDVCKTSFPTEHFDFVITSDILEHVPDPRRALSEISRVLKGGGEHIFTVPFMEGCVESDVRVSLGSDGAMQFLKEPMMHSDPLRKNGALVYTIFGEDLATMCNENGMSFAKVRVNKPALGILGEGLVFVSVKSRASLWEGNQ